MTKKTTKKAQVVRPRLSRPVVVVSATASATPTPVVSTPVFTGTPSSSSSPSVQPSAYVSEDEDYMQPAKFEISTIPIHKLSIHDVSTAEGKGKEPESSEKSEKPVEPFRFLDLPSELRVKIYGYHFEGTDPVVDLTPDNYKKVHRKLFLLCTCRTIYREASYFYYSTHTFRIFPTYPGRFFKTRRPLLARLTQSQRSSMTRLELRLGPGFNKPPKGWIVNRKLGLQDCVNVRTLHVFVQLDPSVSWLDGFRKAGFYETFSRELLQNILSELPGCEIVEFDAYESVRKNCPIMEALQQTTSEHGIRITWGPKNGWTETSENAANMILSKGGGAGHLIINLGGGANSSTGPMINYDSPILSVA